MVIAPPPVRLISSPNFSITSLYNVSRSSPPRRWVNGTFHFETDEKKSMQSLWVKKVNRVAVAYIASQNFKSNSLIPWVQRVWTITCDKFEQPEELFGVYFDLFDCKDAIDREAAPPSDRLPIERGTLLQFPWWIRMFLGVLETVSPQNLHFGRSVSNELSAGHKWAQMSSGLRPMRQTQFPSFEWLKNWKRKRKA